MILWNFLGKQDDNLLAKILTFTLLYGSLYSTYVWTGQCVSGISEPLLSYLTPVNPLAIV